MNEKITNINIGNKNWTYSIENNGFYSNKIKITNPDKKEFKASHKEVSFDNNPVSSEDVKHYIERKLTH